jgi:copper chaperone for superoxide dismutase/copper chaperone
MPTSITTTTQAALAESNPTPLPGMNEEEFSQKVFGICRFVQIAPKTVLMDLTVRLPPPARVGLSTDVGYNVYISSTGNMVNPPTTTGKSWLSLGRITPDKDGYGDMFKEVDGELWEWIGRGCVVEASAGVSEETKADAGSSIGKIFAGVVARSAGTWGNDKTVCACSGRTMWEEGREMDTKSML